MDPLLTILFTELRKEIPIFATLGFPYDLRFEEGMSETGKYEQKYNSQDSSKTYIIMGRKFARAVNYDGEVLKKYLSHEMLHLWFTRTFHGFNRDDMPFFQKLCDKYNIPPASRKFTSEQFKLIWKKHHPEVEIPAEEFPDEV